MYQSGKLVSRLQFQSEVQHEKEFLAQVVCKYVLEVPERKLGQWGGERFVHNK